MSRSVRIQTFVKLVVALGIMSITPGVLAGQSQSALTCEDWAAVSKWTGTMHFTGSGSSTDQNGTTTTVQESATVQFTTSSGPGNCGGDNFGWDWEAQNADVTYSVNMQIAVEGSCRDGHGNPHPETIRYSVANGTYSNKGVQVGLDFSKPANPSYFINLGEGVQEVDGVTVTSTIDPACGPGGGTTVSTEFWGPIPITLNDATTVPLTLLSSSISTLSGSATYQALDAYEVGTSTWTVDWTITPTVDLDVVLTIQDYDTWRPTAGRTEKDFGGGLILEAQMYTKSTNKPTDAVLADKWSFKLADVSHEPGVALNWPAKANLAFPSPADLTFDDPVNHITYANASISTDGTTMDIPLDPKNLVTGVVVLLDSRDWGAWATLNLSVTVGGQVIKAHFLNDTKTDILIPKRQSGSLIADGWKTAHNIPLDTPDLDDSENDPVGDGNRGDGLTLYEEYRGFYMGCARSGGYPTQEGTGGATCAHVEGDPAKKDLFVASELSAEESLGIKKFKEETKLNVHYKGLSKDEIGADHLINFNFGAGPHLQNGLTSGQHALYVRWDADRGTSTAVGGPGVPRKIDTIFLAGGDDSLSEKPPGFNDGNNYFTATVAHELSHGVDVYHHGENGSGTVYWYADDTGQVWETTFADALQHPVVGTGVPIQVFPEDQDPRTATPTSPWTLGLLENCAAMNTTCPPNNTGRNVNLGNRVCGGAVRLHGQFSGDQDCYMRYDAAEAYIPSGFPNIRYFKVEEITGQHLTDTTAGTAVNDPNHMTGLGPLSRYGDADTAHQRGNCLSQVNVNDLTDPPARDAPTSCAAN